MTPTAVSSMEEDGVCTVDDLINEVFQPAGREEVELTKAVKRKVSCMWV